MSKIDRKMPLKNIRTWSAVNERKAYLISCQCKRAPRQPEKASLYHSDTARGFAQPTGMLEHLSSPSTEGFRYRKGERASSRWFHFVNINRCANTLRAKATQNVRRRFEAHPMPIIPFGAVPKIVPDGIWDSIFHLVRWKEMAHKGTYHASLTRSEHTPKIPTFI